MIAFVLSAIVHYVFFHFYRMLSLFVVLIAFVLSAIVNYAFFALVARFLPVFIELGFLRLLGIRSIDFVDFLNDPFQSVVNRAFG